MEACEAGCNPQKESALLCWCDSGMQGAQEQVVLEGLLLCDCSPAHVAQATVPRHQ